MPNEHQDDWKKELPRIVANMTSGQRDALEIGRIEGLTQAAMLIERRMTSSDLKTLLLADIEAASKRSIASCTP